MSERKPATIAVRTGIESDSQHNAVVPPIYLSTNYSFPEFGDVPKYDYARSGNPTRTQLETTLSDLECGAGAVVTNCGTSALNLMVSALLGPDDLIVAPHDCYGGTYRLFNTRANKGDFQTLFVDQSDTEALDAAIAKKPKLILGFLNSFIFKFSTNSLSGYFSSSIALKSSANSSSPSR